MKRESIDYKHRFVEENAWGLHTCLDIHRCNPETIRSAEAIRDFAVQLCDKIKMKRFGEPTIVHFGEDETVAGYSLVQLIETSLISGHFANLTNHVYLDIFSCKYYNPYDVIDFTMSFFEGESCTPHILIRR